MKALLATLAALGTATALIFPAAVGAQQGASTERIVIAADSFLSTLTAEQRQHVLYDFNDQTQRARWSNFPTGVVPRGGISLRQMNAPQRDATMQLLSSVLSPMGLQKLNAIRQADDDFKANGSKRGPGGPGGAGGGGPRAAGERGSAGASGGPDGRARLSADDLFGSDLYFISLLGQPSATRPWMLQFGGHHLALNITISGDRGVLTPTLTGAQPAAFDLNGKTIRPLGRESDKALALMHSLDISQRQRAVLAYRVADLVLGPGQDGKTIVADGLKVSEMNSEQQALLLDVVAEWVGIMNDRSAAARMAEIKADLASTWFAWSGPTTGNPGSNISAYYRIQGPRLVIEYAPQTDEPTNHVHTIYRDPTNDYGRPTVKP